MTPRGHKIGVEEKGQRAARSTDVYHVETASREVAVCSGCNALYWNKRWYIDENESSKLSRGHDQRKRPVSGMPAYARQQSRWSRCLHR